MDAGRKITPRGRGGTRHLPSMLLDAEGDELHNVQEEIPFPVVLDSGAADHVSDNVDAPGYVVEPSPGSRAGRGFIAANGAKIPNRGQMKLALKTEDGKPIESVFQVCETSRPLWSVGKICDNGCTVVFDAAKAEVIRKSDGRSLCTFQRSGGLYVANLNLTNPKRPSSFTRQGKSS